MNKTGLVKPCSAVTHRELASPRHDVDGVLLLADVAQTRPLAASCHPSVFTSPPLGSRLFSSCLLSPSVLGFILGPSVLQSDAQCEVLGQMVHRSVSCCLHISDKGKADDGDVLYL